MALFCREFSDFGCVGEGFGLYVWLHVPWELNWQRKRQGLETTYKAIKVVKAKDDESLRQGRDNKNVEECMIANVT